MPASKNRKISTADLIDAYRNARKTTETLCEPLEIEDYVPQPVVDVSPPKWNIGHTTWFFEEMILKKFSKGYRVFDTNFGFLFNSYYDSIGSRTVRGNRGDLSRPTVKRVFEYRQFVDERMTELLTGEISREVADLVILGINHEQQHQELFLTDLKYSLSVNPLFPIYRENFALSEICEMTSNGFAEISEGLYEIGFKGDGFCFDNELGRHTVYLHDYKIRKSLTTNAEFIEFIEDGGYEDFRLWHSEGWDWVKLNKINSPLYWRLKDDRWFHFTLSGLRELNTDAPVCHISYYEAAAFAEWKGMRLPTEFEWEAASDSLNWGLRWEWTNSAYLPYPNFTKPAGAVGEYNGKFMINQMVLRGGSTATPENHSRKTYRNFFHPPLRWQYTGLRLAK